MLSEYTLAPGGKSRAADGGRPQALAWREDEMDRGRQRNLWCPHYLNCLGAAVSGRWWDFSCGECPRRVLSNRPRVEEITGSEVVGWEDIWRAGWPV